MGKRLNVRFVEEYIKLDTACCVKFGIKSSGVSEYISRLYNTRLAPGRDGTLEQLVRYRSARNRLAHEEGAMSQTSELNKKDVRWVKKFTRLVKRSKDPISTYLKRAKNRAAFRKVKIAFFTVLFLALAILVGLLFV
jgi:hypothetical protein